MIVGFGTRRVTDEIIKPFVTSAGGKWFRPLHRDGIHAVNPFELTKWAGYDHNEWLEDKPDSVVFGILRGTEKVLSKCKEFGVNYYYFDHAYFFKAEGHKPHPILQRRQYRITINGENLNYITELNGSDRTRIVRYQNNLPELSNQRKGDKILIIPPTEAVCRYYNIHSLKHWKLSIGDKLEKYTDREFFFREKTSETPLEKDLEQAHVVVTHQSTVGIKAHMQGIPVISENVSMCKPISINYEDIEKDYKRDDDLTMKWIDSLLANQWTDDEIRSGRAKEDIDRLQNASRRNNI